MATLPSRGHFPIIREYRAARTIARQITRPGEQVERGSINTIIGGVLALMDVAGIIFLSATGKDVPDVLKGIAFGAAAWFFTTSVPTVTGAVNREAKPPKKAGIE